MLIPLVCDEAILDIYARLDGLLLAGGGDVEPSRFGQRRAAKLRSVDPARDHTELLLVRRAIDCDMPLLAICRGLQVLNVALGGTLYQDIPSQLPLALRHDFSNQARNYRGHEVLVWAGTRLAEIVGARCLSVNSFHHQAAKDIASPLRVAAEAADGIVEGLEAEGKRFVVGVQWHPEELVEDDPRMLQLFRALVAEAGRP